MSSAGYGLSYASFRSPGNMPSCGWVSWTNAVVWSSPWETTPDLPREVQQLWGRAEMSKALGFPPASPFFQCLRDHHPHQSPAVLRSLRSPCSVVQVTFSCSLCMTFPAQSRLSSPVQRCGDSNTCNMPNLKTITICH